METKEQMITAIAKFIDKDKYNPILTSMNYDKYLEKVLTELVNNCIKLNDLQKNDD